jgi:hypothetical protein
VKTYNNLLSKKKGEHMDLTAQQYGLLAEEKVKKILEHEYRTTFAKCKLVLGKNLMAIKLKRNSILYQMMDRLW